MTIETIFVDIFVPTIKPTPTDLRPTSETTFIAKLSIQEH